MGTFKVIDTAETSGGSVIRGSSGTYYILYYDDDASAFRFKSTTDFESFTNLTAPTTSETFYTIDIGFAIDSNENVYVLLIDGQNERNYDYYKVFKYTKATDSWAAVQTLTPGYWGWQGFPTICVDDNDVPHVFYSIWDNEDDTGSHLYHYYTSGGSWTYEIIFSRVWSTWGLIVSGGYSYLLCGADGTLYYSYVYRPAGTTDAKIVEVTGITGSWNEILLKTVTGGNNATYVRGQTVTSTGVYCIMYKETAGTDTINTIEYDGVNLTEVQIASEPLGNYNNFVSFQCLYVDRTDKLHYVFGHTPNTAFYRISKVAGAGSWGDVETLETAERNITWPGQELNHHMPAAGQPNLVEEDGIFEVCDTVEGLEVYFITLPPLPLVTTLPCTSYSQRSAILGGQYTWTDAVIGIEYWSSPGWVFRTQATMTGAYTGYIKYFNVSGLAIGRTYYFRAFILYEGAYYYGDTLNFTTDGAIIYLPLRTEYVNARYAIRKIERVALGRSYADTVGQFVYESRLARNA